MSIARADMAFVWAFLIVLTLGTEFVCDALKLPHFIQPCSRSDPKFNECGLKSARMAKDAIIKGDHKYHLLPLDPMEITQLNIDRTGGSVGLNITFNNMKLYGLKDASIDSFSWDMENKEIHYSLFAPEYHIESEYVATGQVLVLPVHGHGKANITSHNCKTTYKMTYELRTKHHGKVYMHLHSPQGELTCTSGHSQMDNLFNGNKILSDQMNLFMNDNWEVLFHEIGPSLSDGITLAIHQSFVSMLDRIPFNEITIE